MKKYLFIILSSLILSGCSSSDVAKQEAPAATETTAQTTEVSAQSIANEPASEPDAAAADQSNGPPKKFGESFVIDDIRYNWKSCKAQSSVGSSFLRKSAPKNAKFLILKFTETNIGDSTVDLLNNRVCLATRTDPVKVFTPDAQATSTAVMSGAEGNLYTTQLQPDVETPQTLVFQLSSKYTMQDLGLIVSNGKEGDEAKYQLALFEK